MDLSVGKSLWEVLAVDTLSSLPRSTNGYRLILVVVDVASRWLELLPLRSTDPLEVAFTLEQSIFLTFGPSSSMIVPTNKPEFLGAFPKILKKYDINKINAENASSRMLTIAERCKRIAKKSLQYKMREYPKVPWDHLLKHVAYSFRNQRPPSMKLSPQEMILPFRRDSEDMKSGDRSEKMNMEKTDVATETDSKFDKIGAKRNNLFSLEEERSWFQMNVERFHGLSLSLKAEALRSKILVDHSATDQGSLKTRTAMTMGRYTTRF